MMTRAQLRKTSVSLFALLILTACPSKHEASRQQPSAIPTSHPPTDVVPPTRTVAPPFESVCHAGEGAVRCVTRLFEFQLAPGWRQIEVEGNNPATLSYAKDKEALTIFAWPQHNPDYSEYDSDETLYLSIDRTHRRYRITGRQRFDCDPKVGPCSVGDGIYQAHAGVLGSDMRFIDGWEYQFAFTDRRSESAGSRAQATFEKILKSFRFKCSRCRVGAATY